MGLLENRRVSRKGLKMRRPPRIPLPWWRQALRAVVWSAFLVLVIYRIFYFEPADQWGRGGWGGRPLAGGEGAPRRLREWQHPGHGHSFGLKTPASLPTNLARLRIEVAPKDVDLLRSTRGMLGGPGRSPAAAEDARPEVKVTVREGTQTWTHVALHLKGAAGSFRPFDDRPALTLNFSKHVKGQRFHGMPKISLNNSVQDPTFISEALCRELYREAGVPTPRTDHVTVVINDRDLGLYLLTEGWGKAFLKQHFPDADGNLYDGGFVHDVFDGPMEVVSGESQDEHPGLERLSAALRDPDRAHRWTLLSAALDTERFITMTAIDALICHWDGYAMNRNNYRVFEDRSTGRMVFMPHGLDQTFGVGRRMSPDAPVRLPTRSVVARAVGQSTEGRARYNERLRELTGTIFDADRMTRRVREIADRIRPTIAAYGPRMATEHDLWVGDMVQRIQQRVRSVTHQLSAPVRPPAAETNRVIQLSGWRPQSARNESGQVQFTRSEANGSPELRIRLDGTYGSGSWRAVAVLDVGTYRFSGRVRVEGGDPAASTALRIAGQRIQPVQPEPSGWTPLSFTVEVEEPGTELEFVAEFSGWRGAAAFDEPSLILTRMD